MIIIPLDRKLGWHNLPVVTFGIILINILCYFVWQSGDDERFLQAIDYYDESGLGDIEWKYYLEYKSQHDTAETASLPKEPDAYLQYSHIIQDNGFMEKLLSDQVITADNTEFPDWKKKRQQFNQLLSKVVYINWGLRTALPRWDSILGHMFLHGGIMHLLGNMIFLLAVGFLVEGAIGHAAFLICYLLVGFGSAGFDFIFRANDFTPSIGASGAVAGLMGMYTVLYWKKRIRFFYFIFVYFDYVSLPAIALLPLWIGNEVFHIFAYPDSHVNYFAHLGGLVTGALLAAALRLLHFPMSQENDESTQTVEDFSQRFEWAQNLCDRLDYRRALPVLAELHREQPENIPVMVLLHEAARIDAQGDTFHRISQHLLSRPVVDSADKQLRKEVFREYLKHAKPGPRLNRQLVCDLLDWFIGVGAYREAEILAKGIAKKHWQCDQLTEMLYRLADLAEEHGDLRKSELYRGAATNPVAE